MLEENGAAISNTHGNKVATRAHDSTIIALNAQSALKRGILPDSYCNILPGNNHCLQSIDRSLNHNTGYQHTPLEKI